MRRRQYLARNTLYFIGILVLPVPVNAVDWQTDKGVTVSEIYTDNENLDEINTHSSLITTVTPYLSIKRQTGKVSANVNAQLAMSTSGDGHVNPRLGATAKAEVLDNRFFVDASANVTQNTVDAFRASSLDSLNDTNNSTTTYNVQIAPYTLSHFESFADLRTRYTFNHQTNSSGDVGDSYSHRFAVNLNSGSDFQRFDWSVASSYKDTSSSDDESSSDLASLDATVGYRISRLLRLSLTAGEEWNDYVTTKSENSGGRWQGGLHWTPSPRTNLNIGYGERYFGSWPTFSLTHRIRHSTFSASYSRELTDSATQLSEIQTYQTVNSQGQPINPITGEIIPSINQGVNITKGLYVDERLMLAWALTGRRSSVTVSGVQSRQIYEDGRPDETSINYSISFNRSLSPITTFSTSYSIRDQSSDSGVGSQTQTVSFGLSRRLANAGILTLSYLNSRRDSNLALDDYTENRVQLGYTVHF